MPDSESITPSSPDFAPKNRPDSLSAVPVVAYKKRVEGIRGAVLADAALLEKISSLPPDEFRIPPVSIIATPQASNTGHTDSYTEFDVSEVVGQKRKEATLKEEVGKHKKILEPLQREMDQVQDKLTDNMFDRFDHENKRGFKRLTSLFKKPYLRIKKMQLHLDESALAMQIESPARDMQAKQKEAEVARKNINGSVGEYGLAELVAVKKAYEELIKEISSDENVVKELRPEAIASCASFVLAGFCAEDIDTFVKVLEKYPQENNYRLTIDWKNKAENAIAPSDWASHNKNSFGENVKERMRGLTPDQFPNASYWYEFKNSPEMQAIFGDTISKLDDSIYQYASKKALTDQNGDVVRMLAFYPTPDTVRTLAIIANDTGRHYPEHVNQALTKLAKGENWNLLVDESIELYPELMPLKTILKEWNYDDRGFNPDLSYARSEFYWNLISTQPTDEQERIIALKGLSNGYLLRLIEGNGGVSSEVSKTILEAGTLLVAFDDQFGDRFQDFVSPFKKRVRESLLYSIDPSLVQGDMEPPSIDQYVVVAREIAKHPEDTLRISYLSHGEVIDRMIQLRDNPDKIAQFVKAYEACPELVTNDALLDQFAKQFEGEQTTVFFKRFVDVSGNLSRENMTLLLEWVGEKKLTQDRVISLASRIDTIPQEILKIVVEAPGLFLASDDGLLLADHIKQGTVLEMGEELDKKAGKLFQAFERNNNSLLNSSIAKELSALILRGDTLVKDGVYKKVDRSNWKQMLALYVRTQVPLRMHEISEETNAFIREEFGKSEVKDLIMQNMRSEWTSYLTGEEQAMPYSLYLLTHFIDAVGVGPLSQVEAFASLMSSVRRADSKSTTTDKTRSEITQGLLNIENRFVKERWSNEDRTGFYASSKDIIDVSPSLYSEYLSLFEACSQQQLKQFNREIYPLHRAILALSATRDADGTNHYNSRDLVSIRHDIQNLKNLVGNDPEVFVKEKDRLIGGLKELFQDRFGIKEIPEEFTNEHIRSLTNVSLYVANLSERNTQNEAVLGFYLALTMNEKWEELREGNAPAPELFMTSEKTAIISPLLQERASNPVLSAKELGIEEAQFHDFMKALQAETEEMTITSTQTVDVKLINIIRNLSGFEDPDFYENPLDKARMQLLLTYGNKQVGQTAAKLFLSFANPDKAKPFTKEEEAVRDAIVKSMESSGIDVNAENIKMHMQDGLKPFATISNLMNTMRDLKVESTVDDLQSQLVPSKNIVEIFARLGEEFTHTSGAMALSNDLNYLDSLVVRKSDLLTPPEMEQLQEYIHGIREQVVTLESVYEQVQNKFKSASQSLKGAVSPAIEERFAEIDSIFNNSLDSQVIISKVSHDLDVIIENMRECLSCTKQGVNNDTNLTFGDPNKFYVYTSVEGKPGSISDQVTFLSPVTRTNGTTEMAFVFDRLYGANTPVVLENQVAAVLKKYKELKTLFPDAKLSLFVTDAAMFTGGISPELFAHALEEYEVSIVEEELEVNVKPSVFNQPYVEFGGGFRSPGPRTVKGLTLR